MRRIRFIALLGSTVLLLAGCGGGEETEQKPLRPLSPTRELRGGEETEPTPLRPLSPVRELHVGLDGYASPAAAGILMAAKRGYFEDRGLKVWITSPYGPLRPVRYVAEEEVEVGISHAPQVALAHEKGVPILAVASLVPKPTAAMIWLENSEIGDIADLKGKTIAVPGLSFQGELLENVLAQAGLAPTDVEIEPVGYGLESALTSGQADAIFGGSSNIEGAELETRGLQPVITEVTELGVPDFDELVLIARRDRLSKEPELFRNFLVAVARGTAEAVEDPRAAVNAITQSVDSNPEVSRKATEAEVEATLPLLSRDGFMDPDQMEGLTEWMQEEGMTRQSLPASELLTNEYLTPQP